MPDNNITGLTPATQEVFEQVSQLECIKDLFLCGGTGQSLQMNHRLSEDLDFELIGLRRERPELDFGAITLQELLGMKLYAICVRTVFRDYYDIYCLLQAGCNLDEAVSYASYLSRHTIRSKTMYTRLLSPQLFCKNEDFQRMSPRYDVSTEEIRDFVKTVMEASR